MKVVLVVVDLILSPTSTSLVINHLVLSRHFHTAVVSCAHVSVTAPANFKVSFPLSPMAGICWLRNALKWPLLKYKIQGLAVMSCFHNKSVEKHNDTRYSKEYCKLSQNHRTYAYSWEQTSQWRELVLCSNSSIKMSRSQIINFVAFWLSEFCVVMVVLPFSVVFNNTKHNHIIQNVYAHQFEQRAPVCPLANRATPVGVQLKRRASSKCKAETVIEQLLMYMLLDVTDRCQCSVALRGSVPTEESATSSAVCSLQ